MVIIADKTEKKDATERKNNDNETDKLPDFNDSAAGSGLYHDGGLCD